MPAPTQFGGAFWGDYTGLSAWTGTAHPAWSDTRTPQLVVCPGTATTRLPPLLCVQPLGGGRVANDQEVATRAMPVPIP
jgi:hypothetical protein